MGWESDKKLWDALLAVQHWLNVDFLDKVNHASAITIEDWKPFSDAHQTLTDERFSVDSAVFRLSRQALVESLYTKLGAFVELTNRQIQARDASDGPLQKQLLAQMGTDYTTLVREYEDDLHEIKTAFDAAQRTGPMISLPALQHVGGGIIIASPNARQENNVINARAGSTVTAPAAIHNDHSTHVTSTVTNSPGAIANVAQHMANVTSRIAGQVEASNAGEDVKALMKQLIEQIASINAAANPATVRQMADDLKTLGDEMARPQPRRKWYDLSLQGIKEAAEAVGEVGKPIIQTVMHLIPLLA